VEEIEGTITEFQDRMKRLSFKGIIPSGIRVCALEPNASKGRFEPLVKRE